MNRQINATLEAFAVAVAKEYGGTTLRKGAAIEMRQGDATIRFTPLTEPSASWCLVEFVYPPGVKRDHRIGPTAKRFPWTTTAGFEYWKETCGQMELYKNDLKRANYRRGTDDEVLDDAGSGGRNGVVADGRVALGGQARRSDGGSPAPDRRDDAGANAVGQGPGRADTPEGADAGRPGEVRGAVPRGLGDAPEGSRIGDEKKRRIRNTRAENRLKRATERIAAERAGLSQLAPPKIGRPPMAFFYVRWSDARQGQGTTERQQLEAIERVYDLEYARDFAKAPEAYKDMGVSSKFVPFLDREMGKQLLADVQSGDLIIAHRGDRLFRSLKDTIATMDRLHGMGVRFRLADSGMQTDWGTPSGKLIFSILGAVAEYDNELRAARVKDARRIRAAEGRDLGGWLHSFVERVRYHKRKIQVIRREYVDLVDWIACELRAGGKCPAISKEAAKRAAAIEGEKYRASRTYGFGLRTIENLKPALLAWDRETARTIRVDGEPRYVWSPVKKGVEVEV